jgi:1,4-alpha-glucan branching enzyme
MFITPIPTPHNKVMVFMGTEWAQSGWWNNDEHHSPNWQLVKHPSNAQIHRLANLHILSCASIFS